MSAASNTLFALAAIALLGCRDDKSAPGTTSTAMVASSAASSSAALAAAPSATTSATAIVHQPGTVPPPPSAHRSAGAPGTPAPEPTFATIAALEKSRTVEATSLYPRWSGRAATLGLPLSKGLLVADIAKGSGFLITTHAAPSSFALSRDEGQLAVSDGSGRITLWDTRKGTLLRTFPLGGDTVALSPDGSTLAAGGEGLVAWDAKAGTELLHITDKQVFDIAFAEGGKELVTSNTVEVVAYDRSGKIKPGGGGAQTGGTFRTTVSPNGRWAAASAPDGHGLQVFEVHAWRPRQLVIIDACDEHVWPHFSESGHFVFAMGGGRWVKGFEVGSFRPYASYHAAAGRELAGFADDLSRVVVTRARVDAAVVVVATKAEIKLEKAFTEDAAYTFSGDGRFIAGSAAKAMRVWDAKTGKLLYEIQG